MIWPMFLDENGRELPVGAIVPQVSKAHFYIHKNKATPALYREWLREKACFHLSEGNRRVAACQVVKILSLPEA
jgi:hypothetical protein